MKALSILMISVLCHPAALCQNPKAVEQEAHVSQWQNVYVVKQIAQFDIGSTYYTPGGTIQYRVDKQGRFYHSPGGSYIGKVDNHGRIYNNKGAFIGRIGFQSFELIL